jgi:hypothetical protein
MLRRKGARQERHLKAPQEFLKAPKQFFAENRLIGRDLKQTPP